MDGRKIGDKKKKKSQKTFLTATTMLPLYPAECWMLVFQAPLVWGSSRGVVLGTHTYMHHFIVVMNYIHVFNVFE